MSISVKHLNADTTFLITFSPETKASPNRHVNRDSEFSILVDPWLAGSSSIWNPRFQISHHTSDPIVYSLAHIRLPDIILISQDKPDHCHEETLRSLPADSPVHIIAVPAAARKIKSWHYFTHARITPIQPYNSKNGNSVYRIPLKSRNGHGSPGEITISYITQKLDMTNLHNAMGITYLPPSSTNQPLDHHGMPMTLPLSPPMTPTTSRSSANPSPELRAHHPQQTSPLTPESATFQLDPLFIPNYASSRPLSILYTPHGIGIPCISNFMNTHLAPMHALPLNLLLHSINIEQNPWFLGGRVASGFPGGVALVKTFGARYWLSAHDEDKDNRGWSTAMIKSRHYTVEEAQVLLDDELERARDERAVNDRRGSGMTTLVNLEVGEELLI